MIDILKNVMGIAARVHDMQLAGTLSMIVFGVVLVFGIMNCVLGYRILRFWMMIFGFLIGAGIGLFAVNQIGLGEKLYYVVGMVGAGLILAILSFAVFKAGIFIIGAGIGLTLTIYIIHPTTSFSFFICLLAGVGLGMLALRYEREVIIVGTSILGGILSGFATARLANMEEIPFGIVFSIGFALIGMLIQFAINKPKDDRDYSEDEEEKRVKCRASSDDEDEEENVSDYSYDDLDEDLSNADEEEIDEILDEYGVDEDEVIEEYLEDYYGENKKKKRSASPYQKKDRRSK
nr:DUF4203 domain-containing protein [uncultured Blautia sp.]